MFGSFHESEAPKLKKQLQQKITLPKFNMEPQN